MTAVAEALPTSAPSTTGHRTDIPVLRALAVVAVILYHLPSQWNFEGGLVGVDVFFVISGYVVTESLARQLRGSR